MCRRFYLVYSINTVMLIHFNTVFVTSNSVFFCTQVDEVPGDFTQSDLATDDVMLLDTFDQV